VFVENKTKVASTVGLDLRQIARL